MKEGNAAAESAGARSLRILVVDDNPDITESLSMLLTSDSAIEGFAGTYASNNMQLDLDIDGSYMMQESPAGAGRGTWRHDASANALHLTPSDGTPDRFSRVEGEGRLIPLNSSGEPADQMAMLTRHGEATE